MNRFELIIRNLQEHINHIEQEHFAMINEYNKLVYIMGINASQSSMLMQMPPDNRHGQQPYRHIHPETPTITMKTIPSDTMKRIQMLKDYIKDLSTYEIEEPVPANVVIGKEEVKVEKPFLHEKFEKVIQPTAVAMVGSEKEEEPKK